MSFPNVSTTSEGLASFMDFESRRQLDKLNVSHLKAEDITHQWSRPGSRLEQQQSDIKMIYNDVVYT